MKSFFAFFILVALFSLANIIDARKDTGEYWRAVMKDQPMPEAIQGLIQADPTTSSSVSNEKANCHTTESNRKNNNFVKDFGSEPTARSNGIEPTKDKSFTEDFDPSPNVSVYNDGVVKGEKSFAGDFEPRPNVSVYHDPNGKKSFSDDFEPRPSVTGYSS